jgi:hypothetical protein
MKQSLPLHWAKIQIKTRILYLADKLNTFVQLPSAWDAAEGEVYLWLSQLEEVSCSQETEWVLRLKMAYGRVGG